MRRTATAFALLTIALGFDSICWGRPGDRDKTFGANGAVRTGIGEADAAHAVVFRKNGSLVIAGSIDENSSEGQFGMVQYDESGAVVPSFGVGGIVKTSFSDSHCQLICRDAIAQPDGKILFFGESVDNTFLLRYNEDGGIDKSFGDSGRVLGPRDIFTNAATITLARDGKILETHGDTSEDLGVTVRRLTENGKIDKSFGSDGEIQIPSLLSERARALLQDDGSFYLVGTLPERDSHGLESSAIGFVHVLANGVLDPRFGKGGMVHAILGFKYQTGEAGAVRDGKLLVGGRCGQYWNKWDACVARFHLDGTLDISFGQNGYIRLPAVEGDFFDLSQLAVDKNGQILAAGTAFGWKDPDDDRFFTIFRLTDDGKRDSAFGTNGRTAFLEAGGLLYDLKVDARNRIILAGWGDALSKGKFLTMRFLN